MKSKNQELFAYLHSKWFSEATRGREQFLNAEIKYKHYLWDKILLWQFQFNTTTGNTPYQEYTFIKVEPGRGTYTWVDYNENGVQELEEFEIASYIDQANYVKLLLPTRKYLPTLQTQLNQLFIVDFSSLTSQSFWRFWYFQTQWLFEQKKYKEANEWLLNPFGQKDEALAYTQTHHHELWFRKFEDTHQFSYRLEHSQVKSLLNFGSITQQLQNHQWGYQTKINDLLRAKTDAYLKNNDYLSEDYGSKNYRINQRGATATLFYSFHSQWELSGSYEWNAKTNASGGERLVQHQCQLELKSSLRNKTTNSRAKATFYNNQWEGNAYSSAAYQMLEGLKPGKNWVWELYIQRKITDYLELNLNYQGRLSEQSSAIHTGTVQLRAFF